MAADRDNVFGNVDASGVADELVEYLAIVGKRPDIKRVDALTYDLLAIQPGHRLVEAGCGIGDDAAEMAGLAAPGGEVVAIDFAAAMVNTARARHAGVAGLEFREGDVRALDLPDATYDGARAERVLQHLADPVVAARELARVVRPGGRVALADTDWGTFAAGGVDDALVRRIREHMLEKVVTPRAGRHLVAYLAEAGVRDIEAHAVALVDTSLAGAAQVFPMLNTTIPPEAGLVPDDVREEWFAAVAEADAAGRFTALCTMVVAGGVRA